MDFSPTYISAIVVVLVSIFRFFKIDLKSEELAPIIESLVIAISGIVVLVRRYQKGDLTLLGARK